MSAKEFVDALQNKKNLDAETIKWLGFCVLNIYHLFYLIH